MPDLYFPHGFARYLAGGALIGSGVALLFITTGRQGGASSFFSSLWSYVSQAAFFQQPALRNSRHWRLLYALGMLAGGAAMALAGWGVLGTAVAPWQLLLGGVLAGFGARLGGGCTSGHGICGLASLSGGSLAMVLAFLGSAIVTAHLMQAGG